MSAAQLRRADASGSGEGEHDKRGERHLPEVGVEWARILKRRR